MASGDSTLVSSAPVPIVSGRDPGSAVRPSPTPGCGARVGGCALFAVTKRVSLSALPALLSCYKPESEAPLSEQASFPRRGTSNIKIGHDDPTLTGHARPDQRARSASRCSPGTRRPGRRARAARSAGEGWRTVARQLALPDVRHEAVPHAHHVLV